MYIDAWKPTAFNSHKGTYSPPAPSDEAIAAQNERIQAAADASLASATVLRFVFSHVPAGSPDSKCYAESFMARALSPGDEATGQEAGCLSTQAERFVGMQLNSSAVGYLALLVTLEEAKEAKLYAFRPQVAAEEILEGEAA